MKTYLKVLVLFVVGMANANGAENLVELKSQESEYSPSEFFQSLLEGASTLEAKVDFEEYADTSQIIVRGFVDAISDGRRVQYREQPILGEMKTLLMRIEVTKVLKGENVGKYVYVEHVYSGENLEQLIANPYPDEAVLFLRPEHYPLSSYIVENSDGVLLKEADAIYRLTLESTFFSQVQDRSNSSLSEVISPLAHGLPLSVAGAKMRSLEDVEAAIANLTPATRRR